MVAMGMAVVERGVAATGVAAVVRAETVVKMVWVG